MDSDEQQWFLDTIGTEWFLDFSDNVNSVPSGHNKMIYIGSMPGPSVERIQILAEQSPGSVWYVMGEPNRLAEAADVVDALHDLYVAIKDADPTALITSPSLLNWDFTCNGCAGYTSGHEWTNAFRTQYLVRYGIEPPVDIWALDVYPIDWLTLPTVDHELAIEQIDDMRSYLDAIPAHRDKPIWITELSLHWGWDDMEWGVADCGGLPTPKGTYQTDQVIQYLGNIFDWLESNADDMNLEKWFLFTSYSDLTSCNSGAYAGISIFDGTSIGAGLTEVGQYIRNRIFNTDG